jgi:hypothetical protein
LMLFPTPYIPLLGEIGLEMNHPDQLYHKSVPFY